MLNSPVQCHEAHIHLSHGVCDTKLQTKMVEAVKRSAFGLKKYQKHEIMPSGNRAIYEEWENSILGITDWTSITVAAVDSHCS